MTLGELLDKLKFFPRDTFVALGVIQTEGVAPILRSIDLLFYRDNASDSCVCILFTGDEEPVGKRPAAPPPVARLAAARHEPERPVACYICGSLACTDLLHEVEVDALRDAGKLGKPAPKPADARQGTLPGVE